MMQALQTLVHTYCAACLASGILQQFGPAGSGKKIMQSVTGLYLIAAVLLCSGQVRFSLPALPAQAPAAAAAPGQDALLTGPLTETLAQACNRILQEEGIAARASVTVQVSPAGLVTVETISLAGEPDPRAAALLADFQAKQILWNTGEAYE